MSFNDKVPGRRGSGFGSNAARRPSASSSDIMQNLSFELQSYQTASVKLREKMNEIRKKGGACNSIDKEILDGQVKELKEVETRLKNQLDSQNRQLESLVRESCKDYI